MKSFDILSKDLCIHRNTMLEASAGTGKTFTIEHLIIRFLLEEDPITGISLNLDQILAVTFTKKAVLDLKKRVRSALEMAAAALSCDSNEPVPEYLESLIAKQEGGRPLLKAKIDKALSVFEEAQIFTIHSFSMKALMENAFDTGFTQAGEKDNLSKEELLQIAEDFFRTEFSPPEFSQSQLSALLKEMSGDTEKLLRKLISLSSSYHEIEKKRLFPEIKEAFQQKIAGMERAASSEEDALCQLEELLAHFKKNQKKPVDKALRALAKALATHSLDEKDFDELLSQGLNLIGQFSDEERKKSKIPKTALNVELLADLRALFPLIEEGASPHVILVNAADALKRILKRKQEEEGKFSYDTLLCKAWEAAANPRFREAARNRYQVLIIDEFQDTDPMQWGIFSRIFIEGESHAKIFLVGDPKQSIYHFRQADIYTYLKAAEDIGLKERATLSVNYRSRPELIEALNLFFDEAHLPKLIALPKTEGHLPYIPVNAGRPSGKISFPDDKKAMHLVLKDPSDESGEGVSSLVAQEIHALAHSGRIRLGQIAVLVRDRIEGKEIEDALQRAHIPASWQRGKCLIGGFAHKAVIELLEGVIHCKNFNKLKIALSGPIISFPLEKLPDAQSEHFLAVIQETGHLRDVLFDRGFGAFYEELLSSSFGLESSVAERLLSLKDAGQLYDESGKIAERLMDAEGERGLAPDGLLHYLKEALSFEEEDHPEWKIPPNAHEDSVNIITIHSSKGLEYEVVFAVGLSKKSPQPEKIIFQETHGKFVIKALLESDESLYRKWCEEIDAEKIRQLYVAVTRARERVYIYFSDTKKDKLKMGEASPLDLWLAKLSVKEAAYPEVYKALSEDCGPALLKFLKSQNCISYETGKRCETAPFKKAIDTFSLKAAPPIKSERWVKPLLLSSFSSITKELGEEAHFSKDQAPSSFDNTIKSPLTLPAGSKTGVIIHSLFEKIPFEPSKHAPFIRKFLEGGAYAAWSFAIQQMVDLAFTQEIFGFSLSSVDPSKVLREHEFLYPAETGFASSKGPDGDRYLKGVIDLIFFHENRYYLVDWKTNWLGYSVLDYSEENIVKSMDAHQYRLQAKIYIEALKRYVGLFEERPFEEWFGGAYYIYLRGLSRDQGTKTGIAPVLLPKMMEDLL